MPIFEVTDPKTGRTVELESKDNTAPTEQELEAVFTSIATSPDAIFTESKTNQSTTQQDESKPQVQPQNILGALFNVPGATARAAIQKSPALAATGPLAGLIALSGLAGPEAKQAAGLGAAQPDKVPTFQNLALKAASPQTESVAANFAGGIPASVGGLVADMATDPVSVLTSLIGGLKPGKIQPISQVVENDFMKAVRPTTAGMKNYGKIENIRSKATSAVESIVDNKQNIKFTDEAGNEIVGRLPESLDEFSQAISQTKKSIFNQYDTLKKEAGEQGALVPLRPIADEILNAVASKHIEDLSPSVQNYGLQLAERLQKRGTYTLTEAQDAIEGLNNRLKGYFNNPTPEAMHQLTIDRAVVNNLRNSLVKAVEAKSGPQYDILRQQYGNLSAVEEAVTKSAFRNEIGRASGLGKLFDTLSSGDIINGITSLNPGQVTKGATQMALRKFYSHINNPNRIIKNMFANADRIKNIDPKKRAIQSILKKTAATAIVGSAQELNQ